LMLVGLRFLYVNWYYFRPYLMCSHIHIISLPKAVSKAS
jgi:hypothetical protein